jgi:DNA-binding transcriptional LysR family regulator
LADVWAAEVSAGATETWLSLELRHFLAFRAVACESSFTRAAKRLSYTPSAVSQQIAALERIIGHRLIERPGGRRQVWLTPGGEIFLDHASALVSLLGAARADMAAFAAGEHGPLRLGAFQSAGTCLVPAVLKTFLEAWPDVDVQLSESIGDLELVQRIETSELDLAFAAMPLPGPGPFEVLELFHDPFTLVVSIESPLAGLERLDELAKLKNLPLLAFRSCRATDRALARLEELGAPLEVVLRSDNEDTLQRAAAAGMGAALMPRLSLHGDGRGTHVVEFPPAFPDRVVALIWHRDRHLSAAARALIAITRKVAAGHELQALEANPRLAA